jgi:cobalt/nickel transport system permease protein
VIGVQALIFQDGGLAVLGANVFNMGVLTALIGYGIFRLAVSVAGARRPVLLVGAFVAAWASVMAAALATTAQLTLSDTSPWSVAFPAMMGVRALIGVGEGLITAGAVAFVLSTRPDLLRVPDAGPPPVLLREEAAR